MRGWRRITILSFATIVAGAALLFLARRPGRELDSGRIQTLPEPDAIARRIPDDKIQTMPEPDAITQRVPDEINKGMMLDAIEHNRSRGIWGESSSSTTWTSFSVESR